MIGPGSMRRKALAGALLLLSAIVGIAHAAVPTVMAIAIAPETLATAPEPKNPADLLLLADSLKTSDHAEFVKLLEQLGRQTSALSLQQTWYLRYLVAWQVAFSGDYDHAKPLLRAVINDSKDDGLRFRAMATMVNILGIGHNYEEAFSLLDQALDDLPNIPDKYARFQVTGEAAQLLIEAGQYDLAINYANQILVDYPQGRNGCIAMYAKLHAEFSSGLMDAAAKEFQHGTDMCIQAGEGLIKDSIQRDVANYSLQHNQPNVAAAILQSNYADVLTYQYPDLTTEYNASLADAYWKEDNLILAQQFALAALKSAVKGEFSQPLGIAYKVLYQIAQRKRDYSAALAYHEKYMVIDKGTLDDTKEKALAYQIVKQQVEVKKEQLEELNKQNEILQLQRSLDHKAVETGRLYIALLLFVLASIAFWLFRLKRSQLRFMRLARRDGLTGIFNRQHFVDEAEHAFRYVAKSKRSACLILIDMDHFKLINDTYGHAVGDEVLRRAVATCQRYLRSNDVFGRLGGEEFGIVLPECTPEQAIERAEQLRAAINTTSTNESENPTISASFGIASTHQNGYDFRKLLLAADEALYQAKREGRNRVVLNNAYHDAPAANESSDYPLDPGTLRGAWADPAN